VADDAKARLSEPVHTSMERQRDTGALMDALIRGADWAPAGTNAETESEDVATLANKNPARAGLS
jgi:hypothetical protein